MDPVPQPPPPIYSVEKLQKMRIALGKIQERVLQRDNKNFEETDRFQIELIEYVAYLRRKYADAEKYAMFHVLGGSSIDPKIGVTNEDFPGDDSVEGFLEKLAEKYR